MYVMMIQFDCRLPYVHSLKEKRSIRRRLVDSLRKDFSVSIAETNHQDNHKQLTLGISLVSSDAEFLRNLPDKLRNFLETQIEGFISHYQWDVIPWP